MGITVIIVIYLHGWGNMKIAKKETSDVSNVVMMFDGIQNGSRIDTFSNSEISITRCRRCGTWVYMSSDCEWCHKVAA